MREMAFTGPRLRSVVRTRHSMLPFRGRANVGGLILRNDTVVIVLLIGSIALPVSS